MMTASLRLGGARRLREKAVYLSPDHTNPYRPPRSAPVRPPEVTTRSRAAPLVILLILASAAGYFSFTILLLTNGSDLDRKAGWLFCCNCPAFIIWTWMYVRNRPHAYLCGVAGLVGQLLILGLMLAMGIGDVMIVLAINGAIAVGIAAVALTSFLAMKNAHRMSDELP